jgi:hypothetical protein
MEMVGESEFEMIGEYNIIGECYFGEYYFEFFILSGKILEKTVNRFFRETHDGEIHNGGKQVLNSMRTHN